MKIKELKKKLIILKNVTNIVTDIFQEKNYI